MRLEWSESQLNYLIRALRDVHIYVCIFITSTFCSHFKEFCVVLKWVELEWWSCLDTHYMIMRWRRSLLSFRHHWYVYVSRTDVKYVDIRFVKVISHSNVVVLSIDGLKVSSNNKSETYNFYISLKQARRENFFVKKHVHFWCSRRKSIKQWILRISLSDILSIFFTEHRASHNNVM